MAELYSKLLEKAEMTPNDLKAFLDFSKVYFANNNKSELINLLNKASLEDDDIEI